MGASQAVKSLDVIETRIAVDADNSHFKASLILAQQTGLSQGKIKEAMLKGAVWLIQGKSKKRLRRASKLLKAGDQLELNYNPQLLAQSVSAPQLVHDAKDYSIWYKPYGLACQGSRWGDFASISRWVEVNLPTLSDGQQRPVHLVHRLDRATTGLMVLCHSKQAARLFSDMFAESKVDKRYQAIVEGDFSEFANEHSVTTPVQEKAAQSVFSFVDKNQQSSLVNVKLLTGRKHQIRIHLSSLGFPIVGDRLYGNGGDTTPDLQLQSVSLQFVCPLSNQEHLFSIDQELRLQL